MSGFLCSRRRLFEIHMPTVAPSDRGSHTGSGTSQSFRAITFPHVSHGALFNTDTLGVGLPRKKRHRVSKTPKLPAPKFCFRPSLLTSKSRLSPSTHFFLSASPLDLHGVLSRVSLTTGRFRRRPCHARGSRGTAGGSLRRSQRHRSLTPSSVAQSAVVEQAEAGGRRPQLCSVGQQRRCHLLVFPAHHAAAASRQQGQSPFAGQARAQQAGGSGRVVG